ncbi:hypothetical protein BDV93DRAFT_207892 [Ceratobasidium sp. AG-I]|nr:hypothetical protein BDV93DRAFT_207892 [Ceratobasidium sp. AG-I]
MGHNLLCHCHHIPVSARIEGKDVLVCPRLIRSAQSAYRSQNPPCAFQLDDESEESAPRTDASLCHEPYWPRAPAPTNGDWLVWFKPKSQIPKDAVVEAEADLDMPVGEGDAEAQAQFLLQDGEGLVDKQDLAVSRLRALVSELKVDNVQLKDQVTGLKEQVVRLERDNSRLKRKVEDTEDELRKERAAKARRRPFGTMILPRSGSMRSSDDLGNSSI